MNVSDHFECPKCGDNRVEEVMFDVIQSTEVIGFDPEEKCIAYGHSTTDEGEFNRFQCLNCGWKLPVIDFDQLSAYLVNSDRECKPGCYKEPVNGTTTG